MFSGEHMNNIELNGAVASFLSWEQASRDTIDFKRVYVDLANDLVAGLVLSQIVYWYLPDKRGQTKLRVSKDNYLWIAKQRSEWWDEIRVGPRQLDRAIKILEKADLIETKVHRFDGSPMKHIRLKWETFLPACKIKSGNPPENPYLGDEGSEAVDNQFVINDAQLITNPLNGFNQSVKSLTETTTETKENTSLQDAEKSAPADMVGEPESVQTKNVLKVELDDEPNPTPVVPSPPPLANAKAKALSVVPPQRCIRCGVVGEVNDDGFCWACIQARTAEQSQKKAKGEKVATPKKPSIVQPVNDAIAQHLQQIDPTMATGLTGTLAQKAAGVWRRLKDKDKLNAEEYKAVARSLPPFVAWFKVECEGCALPTSPATFESRYAQFVSATVNGKPASSQSDYIEIPHPNHPIGSNIFKRVLSNSSEAMAYANTKRE